MFYPLTLSLLINLCLTANIPLKATDSDGEENSSPNHFHEVAGSLDNFLETLSDVTQSLDSVAADLKKVCCFSQPSQVWERNNISDLQSDSSEDNNADKFLEK